MIADARAVITLGQGRTDPVDVARRAELRMARKKLLTREDPVRLWAVIDEAVLRRQIGSPEVLREQIEALIEACALRSVRLQILPFRAGGHAAFSILRFPAQDLPDVVYIEHLTSAIYLDKREDADQYAAAMTRLYIEADPRNRRRTFSVARCEISRKSCLPPRSTRTSAWCRCRRVPTAAR